MEAFFSSVKSEAADRFASFGEAKMELFDYIEVFYNQRRRHSTLGQISPAEFERRAMKNEEGVDPMDNRKERGFPQAPHPLSFSLRACNQTLTGCEPLGRRFGTEWRFARMAVLAWLADGEPKKSRT